MDDWQALALALEGTSTKPGHRGYGFRTILKLVEQFKGTVQIVSGEAGIVVAGQIRRRLAGPGRTGTSVTISLPADLEIQDETFYNIVEGAI